MKGKFSGFLLSIILLALCNTVKGQGRKTFQTVGENLDIVILGSGSPNYNKERASSGTLISTKDTKILVDMGSGVRANLQESGLDGKRLDVLLFTHHHIDHNADFDIILNEGVVGRKNLSIYGPSGTEKLTKSYLDLFSQDLNYRLGKTNRNLEERKKDVKVRDLKSSENFEIEGIKVSTLKVPHPIETLAYKFEYNGKVVVITGDLTYSEDVSVFAKNADYLIIDASHVKMKAQKNRIRRPKKEINQSRVKAHLNLTESSKIAKDADVKNLVYTHFRPGIIDEEANLKVIRENYSGNVVFAKDFMKL